MFDFKKLDVYQKSKILANEVNTFVNNNKFDRHVNDQFKKTSLNIMLNIAEGSSRFNNRDRINFLTIARGHAYSCSAMIDFLHDNQSISDNDFDSFENKLEIISKMLFTLIRNLE